MAAAQSLTIPLALFPSPFWSQLVSCFFPPHTVQTGKWGRSFLLFLFPSSPTFPLSQSTWLCFLRDGLRLFALDIFRRFVASTLYEMCHEAAVSELGECAEIISVQRNQRTRWRPLPLATVEMQKQVSRKLGMSSEVAVQVAEKLYTAGFISYPRTETDIFNKSMDLKRLVSQQVNDVRWGPFASRLLTPPDPSDPISFQWPRAGK